MCPLPYWGGNKFSYVKIVTDDWTQLKTRFKPDPAEKDQKFWKTADWTAVVVCNQDLRKEDGKGDGADGVVALEMYTRSHSEDGRAWTMVNRPGFHITKREKAELKIIFWPKIEILFEKSSHFYQKSTKNFWSNVEI